MSKSLDDILRNKGDLKPRQVEKIFNANGWYIVRTNNHNIYKKEGRSELVIAPIGNMNWKVTVQRLAGHEKTDGVD